MSLEIILGITIVNISYAAQRRALSMYNCKLCKQFKIRQPNKLGQFTFLSQSSFTYTKNAFNMSGSAYNIG